MLKPATILAALLCAGSTALAGAIPQPGDFYLISRDRGGHFVGSHKLFTDYVHGLNKVSYCDRSYFVRSHSVAWTQVEAERGNTVQVEFNFGRGWRPICGNPEQQVKLEDIGITVSAHDLLAKSDEPSAPQSRLSAIGAMFSDTSEEGHATYHTR
ncbi:hypothetical protein V1T76_16360 [Roseibium sp. FZY0029]|uniref:hypothetical protein n=1 Tax=Roseibium sp. FZY0029 TaxID=3116647 RepID=UPI002E9C9A96|nr:hypothetical protein [Roseibium sp. FZY0029]